MCALQILEEERMEGVSGSVTPATGADGAIAAVLVKTSKKIGQKQKAGIIVGSIVGVFVLIGVIIAAVLGGYLVYRRTRASRAMIYNAPQPLGIAAQPTGAPAASAMVSTS